MAEHGTARAEPSRTGTEGRRREQDDCFCPPQMWLVAEIERERENALVALFSPLSSATVNCKHLGMLAGNLEQGGAHGARDMCGGRRCAAVL